MLSRSTTYQLTAPYPQLITPYPPSVPQPSVYWYNHTVAQYRWYLTLSTAHPIAPYLTEGK
eukprot:2453801-Rhodomonas_salina.1